MAFCPIGIGSVGRRRRSYHSQAVIYPENGFTEDRQILQQPSHPSGLQRYPDTTSRTTSAWQLSKFKNMRKCRIRWLRCCISHEPFELKSPSFTGPSRPTCPIPSTGYDITSYFPSEATAKKTSKMPPQTASGEISRERFKR